MNKTKVMILKFLVFSYANMTTTQAKKEYRKSVWWKQAKEVSKYFHKRTRDVVKDEVQKEYELLAQKVAEFDAEYFKDKDFSAYLCMIGILQYLVVELEEEEMTKKFKHYPYDLILKDIHSMDKIREVNKYINRYITALIEMLEEVDDEKIN